MIVTFGTYLITSHFVEAVFENWESEFLQDAAYVMLTVYLYQCGSSESKDPNKQEAVDADPRVSQTDWLEVDHRADARGEPNRYSGVARRHSSAVYH